MSDAGRILIVEDEPSMRRLLATELGADGFAIVEAATLVEARHVASFAPRLTYFGGASRSR